MKSDLHKIDVYVNKCLCIIYRYVYEALDKQLYSTRGNTIYSRVSLRHKLYTMSLPMQPP